ncbi:MAG TPA: Asp-tRNA(Asn)/Glu-tRNA(Gln) amidotransferase subunit GatC [Candidatus Paceibacterota bacterium]|nr:Asp-tRNA(Asn)/Glu-tRNA(Gln) amidotransferase subunit GatC [Candidatus Paceibacterota bacterium]
MISREEIAKLASLSRLKLSDEEVAKMQQDMGAILSYVDKLTSAPIAPEQMGAPVMSTNKNVMRQDEGAHQPGIYTDRLMALAPKQATTKDGAYVKVKKILGGSQ